MSSTQSSDPKTFVPWGLHPVKDWVVDELIKRGSDYGFNGFKPNADSASFTSEQVRSTVHSCWTRVFSNGIADSDSTTINGELKSNHEGFVMHGVNGFNDSYGFSLDGKKTQVLGYDANGKPHELSNSFVQTFPHRPSPGVESIDIETMGGQNSTFSGLCRKATIKWKCYSLDQLEYLTPYFLSPKVSCVIEWGWDNFNPASLVDLKNVENLAKMFGSAKQTMEAIYRSNGNYDCLTGIITEYSYSMTAQGIYECQTVVTSVAWLFEGTDYQNQSLTEEQKEAGGKFVEKQLQTFKEFIENSGLENEPKVGSSLPLPKGRFFQSKDRQDGQANGKRWIRFDYFIEIINHFFSKKYNDIDMHEIKINDTLISAHPGLKSTDVNVLVPNQIAPQYIPKDKVQEKATKITENTEAYQLFKTSVLPSIQDSKLSTNTFDNLYELLNREAVKQGFQGNPFPLLGDTIPQSGVGVYPAGYSGYLKDLFISTELIREEFSKCRTVTDLLTSLLKKMSEALSGVVMLRLEPMPGEEKHLTIIDQKFCPLYKSADRSLPTFTIGDVNHAFMTNFQFGIKMSQEMANQVLFEAGKKELKPGVRKQNTDVTGYGRFVQNDRLFKIGQVAQSPSADISKSDPSSKQSEYNDDSGTKYVDNKINYYLTVDSTLMKKVILGDRSNKAVYLNSAIMPGSTCEIEMLGIGGFTYLGQFALKNVPKQYSYTSAVWQIANIKQSIDKASWKTSISAQVRPMSFVS